MVKDKNDNLRYIIYIVKENDTLASIADKYDVTEKSIIKINELEDTNIVVGQQLYIKPNRGIVPIWLLIVMLVALIAGASFITFSITDYVNNGGSMGGSNNIDVGMVLFSYSEADSAIDIVNAYPMTDELGKALSGTNEYFDFQITFNLNNNPKVKKVTYEIYLTEALISGLKLDPAYIKVYLEENGAAASGFTGVIPTYTNLDNSTHASNAKKLYTKELTTTQTNSYRLRLWVANNYELDNTTRTFKCIVNVIGYVE